MFKEIVKPFILLLLCFAPFVVLPTIEVLRGISNTPISEQLEQAKPYQQNKSQTKPEHVKNLALFAYSVVLSAVLPFSIVWLYSLKYDINIFVIAISLFASLILLPFMQIRVYNLSNNYTIPCINTPLTTPSGYIILNKINYYLKH